MYKELIKTIALFIAKPVKAWEYINTKNPTENKNKYCVLRFNFSGIDSSTEETTIYGFKNEVATSIEVFVHKYNLDFYVNKEDEAENILDNLFNSFSFTKSQK